MRAAHFCDHDIDSMKLEGDVDILKRYSSTPKMKLLAKDSQNLEPLYKCLSTKVTGQSQMSKATNQL